MLIQNLLQFFQINVSLERMINFGIECFVYCAINSDGLPEFDVPLGGVEMRITGN